MQSKEMVVVAHSSDVQQQQSFQHMHYARSSDYATVDKVAGAYPING